MPGRYQWWKTCSEMVNLASQKQLWWAQARLFCLWKAIFRNRTHLGQSMWCHVQAIRSHELGWQAGPTQCQCIKPVGRLPINYPSLTEWYIDARGPEYPTCVCLHYDHLVFAARMGTYQNRGSLAPMNAWRSLGIPFRCHTMTEVGHHNVAVTMAPSPSPSLDWGFKSDRN